MVTGINITSRGIKHLEATVGSEEYKKESISKEVQKWLVPITVMLLAVMARSISAISEDLLRKVFGK